MYLKKIKNNILIIYKILKITEIDRHDFDKNCFILLYVDLFPCDKSTFIDTVSHYSLLENTYKYITKLGEYVQSNLFFFCSTYVYIYILKELF